MHDFSGFWNAICRLGWYPELPEISSHHGCFHTQSYGSVRLSNPTGLTYLYIILLAPIAEELTFRGLTYRFARKLFLSGVQTFCRHCFFGVIHMNMIQGIYAFVLGLFLGLCKNGHGIKYSSQHVIFNILGSVFSNFFEVTLD